MSNGGGKHIMIDLKEFGELKANVNSVKENISNIWRELDGNGREGLIPRSIRTEETVNKNREDIKELTEEIKCLSKGVYNITSELKDIKKSLAPKNILLSIPLKYLMTFAGLSFTMLTFYVVILIGLVAGIDIAEALGHLLNLR